MAGSRITPPPPDPNLLIQYDIHIPGEAGEFYVDDPAFDGEEDDSCWWEPSLAKKLGSLAEMGHEGARLVYQWGMGVAVVVVSSPSRCLVLTSGAEELHYPLVGAAPTTVARAPPAT